MRLTKRKLLNAAARLQTSNAALKRAKERLRSVKADADAARRRLNTRIGELAADNAEISGLLACSNIGALCIDGEYRIKRFTPAAGAMLNLAATDIGRSINDIEALCSDYTLRADVRTVLEKRVPIETELDCGQVCRCVRRTLPNPAADGRMNGVVVTLTDITKLRSRVDQELAASEAVGHSLERRVYERTEQLRSVMVDLALLEERERRTIATELHDGLGQLLAIANMKLAGLSDHRDNAAYDATLNYVRELVAQAERAARSIIFQISPPVLSELGFVPALEWLGEEMHRLYDLVVKVHHEGRPLPLDQTVRSVLFRCVRELLINVAKHAQVHAADVEIHHSGDQLSISVTDAGVGFKWSALDTNAARNTFGLVSVRERIGSMGGKVEIDSAPGDGTVAIVTVPLVGGMVEFRGRSA